MCTRQVEHVPSLSLSQVMLTRIVQLASGKTFQNGSMRFPGKGLEGERETVRKKWLSELEDAGFHITDKILAMWNNERDRVVLLGGLDDLSISMMLRLLRLLAIEEGAVLGEDQDDICQDAVIMTLEHESQMVAYLALLESGDTEVTKKRERSKLLLDAARIFSSDTRKRVLMLNAIDQIYCGERTKEKLCEGLKGMERAFVQRVLEHLDNSELDSLRKVTQENQIIQAQVLHEPPSHRFFKQKLGIFRRAAQLCDKNGAKKFEDERLFPGDVEKERSFVLDEYMKSWKKFNYHLDQAMERLWQGERSVDALCAGLQNGDYGSRFCILQTLKICQELYGNEEGRSGSLTRTQMPIEEAKELKEDIDLGDSSKLGAVEEPKFQIRKIEFGKSKDAAAGLKEFIGLDDTITFSMVWEDPLRSMRREWFANGSARDTANFKYVVDGIACSDEHLPQHVRTSIAEGKYHGGTLAKDEFDAGHSGMTLEDFVNHATCQHANLKPFHVAALRLYTSCSYPLFIQPLRNRTRPHPIKTTVYVLDEAIKKLRKVLSERNPVEFMQTTTLWRGIKDATMDFKKFKEEGGTELSCMSTSRSRDVALAYAVGTSPLVFRLEAKGLALGVSIRFLSIYPKEEEYLYPPLTLLTQDGEVVEEDGVKIVTIIPQMT